MRPFTSEEISSALPRLSKEAQLELHNIVLSARVERYEEHEKPLVDEVLDGV